jgi:hypothetical protein
VCCGVVVGVQVEGLFNGNTENWTKPGSYAMAVGTFSLAAIQLGYLNKGLAVRANF